MFLKAIISYSQKSAESGNHSLSISDFTLA